MYQNVRMGLALIFYPAPPKTRRPASHRWLMVLSCVLTLMFVYVLGVMMAKRDWLRELSTWWVMLGFAALGPFMLLVMLAGGRRRWAYYLVCAALTVLTLRTVQSTFLFHLNGLYAQWDLMSRTMLDLMGIGMPLLWWRVLFGKPSREYFGMVAPQEVGESKESG
jgi:hypothetical protein